MSKTIGIVGGWQLGLMLTEAAHKLGFKVIVLDYAEKSPAGSVADEYIRGDFYDPAIVKKLAEKVDALTVESDLLNIGSFLDGSITDKPIFPTPKTLAITQDKLRQKAFLAGHGITTTDFVEISNESAGVHAGEILGYPYMLKTRTTASDGKGNVLITQPSDIWTATSALGNKLYAERYMLSSRELAITAVRGISGEIVLYPLVEMHHADHVLQETYMPANISIGAAEKAYTHARRCLHYLESPGVYTIEMFLGGNDVYVNEFSSGVHNAGNWTDYGAQTSQFEQQIRAMMGMPLGPVKAASQAVVMTNILGKRDAPAEAKGMDQAEGVAGVHVHMYNKIDSQINRKMGHIVTLAETIEEAKAKASNAREKISV